MSIQRGQSSIGMQLSSIVAPPNTLPAHGKDTDTIIAELIDKFRDMTVLVEGKADGDKLRTIIAHSNEAIRIQAQDVVLVGNITLAAIENERNGTTSGVLPITITQIIGDKIRTGTITSNNWSTTTGTAIDLNAGNITIGGSTAPKLFFNGTTGDLSVKGTITAGSVIAGTVSVTGVSGVSTIADLAGGSGLDAAGVKALLTAGVDNVLAGLTGDYRLDVSSSGTIFRHKDAQYNVTIGAYAGALRTGLAITANGIAAGYNRTTDGVWVNALAINSSGNATFVGAITATSGTFVGTVSAGSIITNSVTIDGVTLDTVKTNALNGALIKTQLESSGTTILQGVIAPTSSGAIKVGSITWNSSGSLTGGSGIAITSAGIICAQGGTPKFTIDSSGNATFAGSLSGATGTFSGSLSAASGTFTGSLSGATGTFSGSLNTAGQVIATGSTSSGGYFASLVGTPSAGSVNGVLGIGSSGGSGVVGVGGSSTPGVYGISSSSHGVYGISSNSSSGGVTGFNTGGGPGVRAYGLEVIGDITLGTGKITKTNTSGHTVNIYDTATNALVGTYRYSFQ